MRKTTLSITEVKNENAPYGFESLSTTFNEEGKLDIPESLKDVLEIINLSNLVEENKNKLITMLFPKNYMITQHTWCNCRVITPINDNIIRIRTIPLNWDEFLICYNEYTKMNILPQDNLEVIQNKIKEYDFAWDASNKGRNFGENTFLLDDGRYLYNNKGKYMSGLSFICNKNQLITDFYHQDQNLKQIINIHFDGSTCFCYGNYFKSKKGTNCFDITAKNPKYILIRVSWGGAFNETRGIKNVPINPIYYKRASSNGGGLGNDYLIIPINYKNEISIDDI